MKTGKYVRIPFEIEAVRVTNENIDEVAAWCKGEIQTEGDPLVGTRYIKVKVFKPMGERQTQAFVGDWVLFFNGGYKVYMNNSFVRSFEPVGNGRSFDEVLSDAVMAPKHAEIKTELLRGDG